MLPFDWLTGCYRFDKLTSGRLPCHDLVSVNEIILTRLQYQHRVVQ